MLNKIHRHFNRNGRIRLSVLWCVWKSIDSIFLRNSFGNCLFVEMDIFQFIQKPFGILGIHRSQPNQKNSRNSRKTLTYLILVHFSIMPIVFFLVQAKTFREYADSFYISATASLKVCTFTVSLWKISTIFKFIDNVNSAIQKRKYTNPYWFLLYRLNINYF